MAVSLVEEAIAAARSCPDRHKADVLRFLTDDLCNTLGWFAASGTRADMIALVAAWTRVVNALADLPKEELTPSP